MVRYKTEDILPDLPPYTRQTIFLELSRTQRREYDKLQEDFYRWMLEKYPDRRVPGGDAMFMTQFGYAKRRVAEFKIPIILEHINLFLDNNEGKLIIFGLHKNILHAIWNVYSKLNTTTSPFIVGLDGSTSSVQRHEAVHNFNENPHTRLFLGQMQAAGVGLNLQKACKNSLFAELDFSPHVHSQSEARNRRIGSIADHIHYTYLVYRDTIEERVMEMLFQKSQTSVRVIDGQEGVEAEHASFNLIQHLIADTMRRRFGG
jgi:SWI/SNF-related matrix-associated actin-dependent regulator 1 of chromatin subfamily A